MIINAIRKFVEQCPLIEELNGKIKIDFLQDKGNSFSIEPIPVNPVVSNYIGGGGERQYAFTLAIKFMWSDEAQMNLENSGFFEEFEKWIQEKNDNNELPELGSGKQATKLEITSNGYLFGISQDMRYGRYQIQCRLLYEID